MIEIIANDGTRADFRELLRISGTYAALQLELKMELAVADGRTRPESAIRDAAVPAYSK